MYRDRLVSVTHLVRDIMYMVQDMATDAPIPTDSINDIRFHISSFEPNGYGKYNCRVDEIAVVYQKPDSDMDIFRQFVRWDMYCSDRETEPVMQLFNTNDSTEPYLMITVGQRSVMDFLTQYDVCTSDGYFISDFWISTTTKCDSFLPKDSKYPVHYYKLSISSAPVKCSPFDDYYTDNYPF